MKNVFVHILNYMRIDNYFLAANASSAFVFRIIGLKMNRTLWQIVNTKYKLTPPTAHQQQNQTQLRELSRFSFLDMNTESCICIVYHEVNVYILNFYLKTLFLWIFSPRSYTGIWITNFVQNYNLDMYLLLLIILSHIDNVLVTTICIHFTILIFQYSSERILEKLFSIVVSFIHENSLEVVGGVHEKH